MKTSTDEAFEEALDQDLVWRRIELQTLVSQLDNAAKANPDSPTSRAMARALSALLYAHWEGFSRSALERYATLVIRRKPPVGECADGLVVSHVIDLVHRIESGDQNARAEAVELGKRSPSPRLRFSKSRVSNTKSNLRSATLEGLLDALALSNVWCCTKKHLIDVQLCDRRNEIAHGRYSMPTCEEVLDLHRDVLSMLESLRSELVLAVRSRSYRSGGVADTTA